MLELRKPTVADVPNMHAMMRPHVLAEALLPRTRQGIAQGLRDYVVAEEDGQIVGLASVRLVDLHLAEVGAVVCDQPEIRTALLTRILSEVQALGVQRAFILAPEADPYEELGFTRATMEQLPEKRDRQCLRCSRLPRCRQIPLVKEL
jgi:amino-acid N-acetyltransferase